MSAPYTAATVIRIRELAREEYPPGAVAWMLGWPLERLRNICQTHQISFPVPKKKVELKLKGLRWDGRYAWHGELCVPLPPAEGRIFQVMARSPGTLWAHLDLAERAQIHPRSMPVNLHRLRRFLKPIKVELTKRPYRLVRDGENLRD